MTGQELKAITLDERKRVLCKFNNPCRDGYCPTYECNLVDKAKALTDRQWNNIAKEVDKEDIDCVLYEIWKRRIKHGKQN